MIKRIALILTIILLLTACVFAGLDAFTGKVINVADPTAGTDAVNLQYLDNELLSYLLIDGTRAMTGDWSVGGFDFTNMDQLQVNTDIIVSTMTLATGSITDSTGTITFVNENLNTTGTLASGVATIDTTLVLATGSITDSSGTITFVNENLNTTGTFASGVATIDTTLVIATGSITDSTGLIDFNDENLTTTGTATVKRILAGGVSK